MNQLPNQRKKMAGHADRVLKRELDFVAQKFIGSPLHEAVEVREYRDSENTGAEVYCNGIILRAGSNFKLKQKILQMKNKGTLLKYFKRGFALRI